ncbi:unnamed protein product [Phytomonas sp. EM1]|nr:unnamed protein product [Phytomonas sp. EM1]|eukprot:CCW59673.1 unnamed protein product [Phytomonas sp. isolate EM1]
MVKTPQKKIVRPFLVRFRKQDHGDKINPFFHIHPDARHILFV